MTSLKVIFFGYDSEISILASLPPLQELVQHVNRHSDLGLQFLIVDPGATSATYRNITYVKRFVYEWIDDAPIDNMEEEIIFVCVGEDTEQDTYSIMEKLETQRYDKRSYYYAMIDSEIDVDIFIRQWLSTRGPTLKAIAEEEEEEEVKSTSPRHMKPVEHKNEVYRLYSGEAIPGHTSEVDRIAIYWRLLLLCRSIKAYLRIGFHRTYDLAEMRKLPPVETGYTAAPFYTKAQIDFMVRYSYFFQVEDPLLKGFILAHPIKVVANAPSEFSDATRPEAISPLSIDRSIQWLIFNNGQFRQELLLSIMKVVASFAAKNGILTADNVPESGKPTSTVKAKRTPKKKNAPMVTSKRGVITTSGILKPVEVEVEEQEIIKREVVPKFYYEKEVWNIISTELESILGLGKE